MVYRAVAEVVAGAQVSCGSEPSISKVHLKGHPLLRTTLDNLDSCCSPQASKGGPAETTTQGSNSS